MSGVTPVSPGCGRRAWRWKRSRLKLGHRSIESSRVYLHLADGWVAAEYRKAAEAIDAQARVGSGS
jgi:hypothetical protein